MDIIILYIHQWNSPGTKIIIIVIYYNHEDNSVWSLGLSFTIQGEYCHTLEQQYKETASTQVSHSGHFD